MRVLLLEVGLWVVGGGVGVESEEWEGRGEGGGGDGVGGSTRVVGWDGMVLNRMGGDGMGIDVEIEVRLGGDIGRGGEVVG